MDVVYSLAPVGIAIGDQTVTALRNSAVDGDPVGRGDDASYQRTVFFRKVREPSDMSFRYQEDVNGGLRIQILEGQDVIVFENDFRRNLMICDFTENTIGHRIIE